MINYNKISRHLILLITIFLISSATMLSCGNGEPREKYIIESTCSCLISKAEQLQGSIAQATVDSIGFQFLHAVNAETIDVLSDKSIGRLHLIEVTFPVSQNMSNMAPGLNTVQTYTEALKRMVKATGNGFWEITIGDSKWEYNEDTNSVTALNSKAAELLDTITLKIFHNDYYYFNYPSSFNVLFELAEGAVTISGVTDNGTMWAAIIIVRIPQTQDLKEISLRELAEIRVQSYYYESYEINTAYGNPTIDAMVADIKGFRFKTLESMEAQNNYEARLYLIEKDEYIYDILTVALTMPSNLSQLFDPYTSFRFNN